VIYILKAKATLRGSHSSGWRLLAELLITPCALKAEALASGKLQRAAPLILTL
jgi:hypothetical protein